MSINEFIVFDLINIKAFIDRKISNLSFKIRKPNFNMLLNKNFM